MGVLDGKFRAAKPRINALCQSDKTFSEIIGDYEELARVLSAGPAENQVDHIRSSLAGLEEEIMAYLNLRSTVASDTSDE